MEESTIKWRNVVLGAGFSLMILAVILASSLFDTKTKIVFCDVGQGDASYIRVKNKVDVLIDAGGDRKILSCLGKYMPFYDRKIELAILSHPQKDHFYGFNYLLDRYRIDQFLLSPIDNPGKTFQDFRQKIYERKIKIKLPRNGDRINILDSKLTFLWPSQEFINKYLVSGSLRLKDNDKPVLGASTLDDNNFSLVFIYQEEDFGVLFTGDSSPLAQSKLLYQANLKANILKTPHHGSKNGLIAEFLQLADPQVAVISAGQNNPYGHPSKEVLAMLKAQKVKIRRTDAEGDIVIRLR